MSTKARKKVISKVPIQDGKTLEISNTLIKVYKNKETVWVVPIENVRSITPVEKKSIGIHYAEDEPNPIKCKVETFNVNTSRSKTLKLCHEVFKELVSEKRVPKNDKGLLYLRPDEHILSTYSNISINNETGILYITNTGIVHETDNGISTDISFKHITFIKEHNKGITIGWDILLPLLNDPVFSFDLVLPKTVNRRKLSLSIREQFTDFGSSTRDSFSKMDKYYSRFSHDKLYELAKSGDKKFSQYIRKHIRFTFGESSPYFSELEEELITACKIQGWDPDLIASKTVAEERQRIFSQRYKRITDFIEKGLTKYKNEMKELAKYNSESNKIRDMLMQDADFLNLKEKLDHIRDNNPDLVLVAACVNKRRAESMRYYDKRVKILYKKWCQNVPLQKFTDEYDDEWIHYLLDELDTPKGREPLEVKCVNYDTMDGLLGNKHITTRTLEEFVVPNNIKKKDIYNNCWYDERQKMWYLDDPNMSGSLQELADSDPDETEDAIGRPAWGFKKEKVKIFCGFPSVLWQSEGGKTHIEIAISRNTGQTIRQLFLEYINYILPIVRDRDINPEMEKRIGELIYQSTEFQCVIHPSGITMPYTSRMQKFACKRFGFEDVPLNERVRRAIFSVETGLLFNPEANSYLDTNEDPRSYPDVLDDERFD